MNRLPSLRLGLLLLAAVVVPGWAGDNDDDALMTEEVREPTGRTLEYGDKGLEYESPQTGTFLWLGLRFQGRYDSLPGSPTEPADLEETGTGGFEMRRARVKGGGHLFKEWLQVYSEYDFPSETLLDYKLSLRPNDWIGFRVGQWKSEFNRERIDSSGKQQFVDRSLSNYWFTLDRQPGVAGGMRVNAGGALDSVIYLQYLGGEGRGGGFNSGSGLTLLRWQWNPQGKVLDFSQADLGRRENLVSAVTLAGVTGDSPFTRFTGSGGSQLPGIESGDFELSQLMFETAAQWQGWSWQQELHWKQITEKGSGAQRTLWGGYVQSGWLPPVFVDTGLEPLELVARMAFVKPDTSVSGNDQWEHTIGANWYLRGHRSKISVDVSALNFDNPAGGSSGTTRFRVQWDVSF